ncbi:MAG: helix-turn-helix transcriptional regulator [Rhizomicrobium sp.]
MSDGNCDTAELGSLRIRAGVTGRPVGTRIDPTASAHSCEIRALNSEGAVQFLYREIERVGLFRCRSVSGVETLLRSERHVVCVCTQGHIEFEENGRIFRVEGSQGAIMPPTERRLLRWSDDAVLRGVAIFERDFRREANALSRRAPATQLGSARSFDISGNSGKLFFGLIEMLEDEIEHHQAPRSGRPIRAVFERLVVYSLLRIVGEEAADEGRASGVSVAPRHIKRAENYIRAHLAGHLDNTLLAGIAEVSPRSLYRGFVEFRGVTPARYIQELRLDEAHKLLSVDGKAGGIKQIAERVGFRSYASFWRSYVRRYGLPPSKARLPTACENDSAGGGAF